MFSTRSFYSSFFRTTVLPRLATGMLSGIVSGVCLSATAFAADTSTPILLNSTSSLVGLSQSAEHNQLVPVIGTSQASPSVVIKAGQVDQRDYDYFILDNQLQVLLVSDSSADKAAASLDVNVGSADDPRDRAGLAHFLEHMLFLGTEKYPDAAEYQAFISENGGGHNAYTSSEHTNYFFDVNADKLEEALDRFSQFFVAPLFDEGYVDRERNAVHSEYQAKIKDDNRREYDVYRHMVNPDHPYSKFSVGSLTTLADRKDASGNDDKVRDDLLDFYQKHYSSDQMTLVVLGKESVSELREMVKARFAGIPQRNVDHSRAKVPLFTQAQLPVEVISQPVQDIRKMTLVFPLPSMREFYAEKPLSYLGSILGHEGEGSLLSILKQQGWAESLSAGGYEAGAGNASFQISISLTPEGLTQREVIRSLVFHALDVARKDGVNQWRYEEMQQLADVSFQYRENGRAINIVSSLSNNLHYYPASEVLSADYLFKQFDKELLQRTLSKMTPDNVYIGTTYPKAETDQVSHYYQVPYKATPLTVNELTSIKGASAKLVNTLSAQYHLPKKNVFIPEQSALVKLDKTISEPVALAFKDKKSLSKAQGTQGSVVWVKQDVSFQVPKASVRLRIQSPLVSQSVDGAAKNELLTQLVTDRLNENSYPASLAGLAYSLTSNSRGIDLHVGGYDDKLDVLLDMLVAELVTPTFSADRFTNIKSELLRQLRNSQKKTPFRQMFGEIPATIFQPYWSDAELVAAIDGLSLKDVQQFAKQWLAGSEINGLFYGNITAARAEQWKNKVTPLLVDASTLTGDNTITDTIIAPTKVVNITAGKALEDIREHTLKVDHNDSAVVLYAQGTTDTLEDQAKMVLLRQVLESNFYTQLRTEQQLGYIVFLTSLTVKDVPGSAFVVQSPSTSSGDIQKAISQFISTSVAQVPDDIGIYQRSAATKLLEKPQQLSAQAGRYWQDVIRGDGRFDYKERLVDAINQVTAEQLRAYFQSTILDKQHLLWFVADKNQPDASLLSLQPEKDVAKPYYIYP